MLTDPAQVPGVAGSVVVDTDRVLGRHRVLIDGVPLAKVSRNTFDLPGSDGGVVRARLKVATSQPYPALLVDGRLHRLGPTLPRHLAVLTALPLIGILGGIVGAAIGLCGVAVNLWIARSSRPNPVKAFLMVSVLLGSFFAFLLVVAAIYGTSS